MSETSVEVFIQWFVLWKLISVCVIPEVKVIENLERAIISAYLKNYRKQAIEIDLLGADISCLKRLLSMKFRIFIIL